MSPNVINTPTTGGGGVDNKVPQLHTTQSEPVDYLDAN